MQHSTHLTYLSTSGLVDDVIADGCVLVQNQPTVLRPPEVEHCGVSVCSPRALCTLSLVYQLSVCTLLRLLAFAFSAFSLL